MASPASPVSESLNTRKKPFIGVVFRVSGAVILILLALLMFLGAVSTHEPDSASAAGWLLGPVIWLLGSAYRKWKTIPVSEKHAPELKTAQLAARISLGFLLVAIAGTALAIAIPLKQRHERSQRIRRLLDEGKALEPASTRNRLAVRSIIRRDVRNFANFRTQCADLQTSLDENDSLSIKRNDLLTRLAYEYSEYPEALSMVTLFKQIVAEDTRVSSVFREMIACSDTLARSDEGQQKKFVLLCEAPALGQMDVSASTMNALLKQAQEKGAKLPPDIQEAFK
jgi:hypothetical protein